MVNLFIRIVNMSITASVIAVLLSLLRIVLKKYLPATFCYLLWGTVFFRLLVPISIPAIFSLFNFVRHEPVAVSAQSYMVTLDYVESGYVPVNSGDTQTLFLILTSVWLTVAAILLFYTIAVHFYIGRKARTAFALHQQEDVLGECKKLANTNTNVRLYHSSEFETPVVVGVLHPKIILPSFMDISNRPMMVHIITHELVHIKRFDMVTKKLATLALIIHWFNPLIWQCCVQFNKDIETSCDEKTLSILGEANKIGYANTLVELCASARRFWSIAALSFGETAIKTRVAGAINYRRLSKAKNVLLYVVVIAIGIITSTNPVSASNQYIPVHHKISNIAQTEFADAAVLLCGVLERGDPHALLRLSSKSDAYYLPLYAWLEQEPIAVESYRLYPQSESLAYCYLKIDESTQYTAELVREQSHVRLTRLLPSTTFEAAMAVEETEPVRFVRNLHRFGITTGFANPVNIPKPNVAALCIDEEYHDRLKNGEITPEAIYLPPEWIEKAAKDYFGLDNFAYTFDSELYNSALLKYIYSEDRGERIEAQVVAQRSDGDTEFVTAQFYTDPLHMVAAQTITYTLQKKK